MSDQVTIENLLAKIGQLVIQLDIANAQIAALNAKLAEKSSDKSTAEK